VCLQEPPRERERGGVGISHSAYEIRKRKRVWTAIRRGSGLVVDERTDSSRGVNEEVIATDVRRRGERITSSVNVYDQKNMHSGERPARNRAWRRVIWQGSTVLAGDFNAHSIRWDPRCQVQRDAAFWEDVIDENRLQIGNNGEATHHRTRERHEGESVIDLTLANRPITKWSILADDHTTGSDHEVIEWEVEVDRQEEAGLERVVGWNIAPTTEEDAKAAEMLQTELAKERAHLDAECTADEVEQEAAWCQEAMGNVLDATAKKIRICAKSKRWWNADITERRKAVGRDKGSRRNSEEAAKAKAELQKLIRQSKRKMWSKYLQNLRGAEVWRAARYANPRAGMTVESLTDREGKQVNTSQEKEEMLRRESFPPNDDDQYYEIPPAGSAHTRVTEQSVERALFSQSVKQAPGPDKLSFSAIRLLWKWDKERIVRLTKAAIRTGRHPSVWKRASGVVIRKPGKDDYMQLKAYRSISLLSCMGKVVEKVLAELLSDEAERRGLLSDRQFGSRRGRSAIDPAAIMTDRAHAAWKGGHIAGVLLIDIKAAFPSMVKGRLVNLMKVRKMDGDFIRWTESFLSESTVEMIIEGNAMETSAGTWGPTGLTVVTDPLRNLHLRTDQMARRVTIRSRRAVLCRRPRLGGDRERCQPCSLDT